MSSFGNTIKCKNCDKITDNSTGDDSKPTWKKEGWKEVDGEFICPDCQKS